MKMGLNYRGLQKNRVELDKNVQEDNKKKCMVMQNI